MDHLRKKKSSDSNEINRPPTKKGEKRKRKKKKNTDRLRPLQGEGLREQDLGVLDVGEGRGLGQTSPNDGADARPTRLREFRAGDG